MLAFLTSPHSSNQPFTPQKNFFFLELCLWARPLALGRLRSRANSPCSWTPGSSPFLLFLCFRHQVPPPVRGTRPSPRAPASAWPLTPVRAGPPAPRRTCGSGERGAPRGHIWLGGRARVTKTLIHRRSCHHNNRSQGILATAAAGGRGRRSREEAGGVGSAQHAPRATEPRSMRTRGREGATHVAAAAVPAGGDRARRRAAERSRREP